MSQGSRRLLAAALGMVIGMASACGHVGTPAPTAREPQPQRAPEPGQQRELVLVTGSRIPQRVDTTTGLPATASPVRIYTRGDLSKTGRPETADALRSLDPAVGAGR
jgi:hypothetical protein